MMRYVTGVFLFVVATYVSAQEPAADPFAVEPDTDRAVRDEANWQHGSVTFAFDGGSLLCTFGRQDRNDAKSAAMILVPGTAKMQIGKGLLKPQQDVKGSFVVSVEPDGKWKQINHQNVDAWANARVASLTSRASAVEEHAFVATVVYTVNSGNSLTLWGSDAQDALESGEWCRLFAPSQAP